MFTIEQINDAHDRLGSARTFMEYVRALKALDVERADSYMDDGHSEYFGLGGHSVVSQTYMRCSPSLKPVNLSRSFSTCQGLGAERDREVDYRHE